MSQRAVGRFLALTVVAAWFGASGAVGPQRAIGQIVESPEKVEDSGPRLGRPVATRYQVGARIKARGGTVTDIRSMVAVPLECPEQHVEIIEEDVTPNVEVFEYRPTDQGVRQMLVGVSQLSPREEAHALATCEVTTYPILPPEDVSTLHVPKKLLPNVKRYLGRSPFIDVNHRKIKQAVKEALAADDEATEAVEEEEGDAPTADPPAAEQATAPADAAPSEGDSSPGDAPPGDRSPGDQPPAAPGPPSADWTRIEKLYDYARKKVEYEEGDDQSSVQALTNGRGDCQAISALFVAMCRTEKVPARMVWADGHQYAEFYLEDAAGVGRWYPVESAGARAFGEMPTARVILQKGDNFQVPERPRDRLRYASDYTILLSKPGSQPSITYVREQL